jgi:hypothetical protein
MAGIRSPWQAGGVDRDRVSAITHGDRAFHNPLDEARVAEVLAGLGLGAGDRVLDAGCGAGELLVGLAERHGCGGLGFDTSEIAIATSTPEDWERYEWTLIANGDRYVTEHPGEPLAEDVRAWIDAARRRLLAPGGMATIGFALVVLRERPSR